MSVEELKALISDKYILEIRYGDDRRIYCGEFAIPKNPVDDGMEAAEGGFFVDEETGTTVMFYRHVEDTPESEEDDDTEDTEKIRWFAFQ